MVGSDRRAQYEQWVTAHGPEVLRLIRRTLGADDPDVEDCFQDCFVELVKSWTGGDGHPGALLRRIAATNAIDRIRRRQSERRMKIGFGRTISQDGADASTEAAGRDLLRAIHAVLEELPGQQGEAFVLTQLDEMSYVEAGRVLGVEANHVGVLVHRARAVLKAKLGGLRAGEKREVGR